RRPDVRRHVVRFDGDDLDAVLLERLYGLVGGAGVRDDGRYAIEAAQDQARLARELGTVGQDDQFFRLADQALLGLDQQRVRFHQPEQRQAVDAHEHLAGVVVL